MPVSTDNYTITWEKLPDNFVLDDEPVENIDQPLLAAALREILELAGRLQEGMLVASNFGLCATLDGKIVVKAPDWVYVSSVPVVMEFLSATVGDEYSSKPTYPPGKWFFYEQVLQVPTYAIFDPVAGLLEVYQPDESGRYQLQQPDANGRYWIERIGLFLGVWQGTKAERTAYWLRWWDETGRLLLWGAELVEQERLRAERLAAQLRSSGISPEV